MKPQSGGAPPEECEIIHKGSILQIAAGGGNGVPDAPDVLRN